MHHELMQQVHSECNQEAPPEIGMAARPRGVGFILPGRDADHRYCRRRDRLARAGRHTLQAGASLVATSNRPPAELYKGGLQPHVHIPQLVTTLRTHGVVTHELVAQGGDYREVRARASSAAASSNTAAAMCPEHGLTNVSGTGRPAGARASLRTVRFHVSSDGVSSSPALRSSGEERAAMRGRCAGPSTTSGAWRRAAA